MAEWLDGLSLYSVSWYFILYAFVGWCLEVVFCTVNTGKFVNRGFLNGPVCPIYGFGGVILVLVLGPIRNVLLLYVAGVVVCSLLELVAGFLLKKLFHTNWWDYSDQPFNLGGYVCLKFSLLWGIACVVLLLGVHPFVGWLVGLVPTLVGVVLLCVLYAALLADVVVTVVAIRRMDRDLKEIDAIAKALHHNSDRMAESLGGAALKVAGGLEKLELKARSEKLKSTMAERRDALLQRIAESEAGERFTRLAEKRTPVRDRLMRAFPDMKPGRYSDAFEAMKKRHQDWKQRHKTEKKAQKNRDKSTENPE